MLSFLSCCIIVESVAIIFPGCTTNCRLFKIKMCTISNILPRKLILTLFVQVISIYPITEAVDLNSGQLAGLVFGLIFGTLLLAAIFALIGYYLWIKSGRGKPVPDERNLLDVETASRVRIGKRTEPEGKSDKRSRLGNGDRWGLDNQGFDTNTRNNLGAKSDAGLNGSDTSKNTSNSLGKISNGHHPQAGHHNGSFPSNNDPLSSIKSSQIAQRGGSDNVAYTSSLEQLGGRMTHLVEVPLKSKDFAGLGLSIVGSMQEGIFVRSTVHGGPAQESGLIRPGDRIQSLRVSYQNMVYEDALTILSYSSPYDVTVTVEPMESLLRQNDVTTNSSSVKRSATNELDSALRNRRRRSSSGRLGDIKFHPLVRSQSMEHFGDEKKSNLENKKKRLAGESRSKSERHHPPDFGETGNINHKSGNKYEKNERQTSENAFGPEILSPVSTTVYNEGLHHGAKTDSVDKILEIKNTAKETVKLDKLQNEKDYEQGFPPSNPMFFDNFTAGMHKVNPSTNRSVEIESVNLEKSNFGLPVPKNTTLNEESQDAPGLETQFDSLESTVRSRAPLIKQTSRFQDLTIEMEDLEMEQQTIVDSASGSYDISDGASERKRPNELGSGSVAGLDVLPKHDYGLIPSVNQLNKRLDFHDENSKLSYAESTESKLSADTTHLQPKLMPYQQNTETDQTQTMETFRTFEADSSTGHDLQSQTDNRSSGELQNDVPSNPRAQFDSNATPAIKVQPSHSFTSKAKERIGNYSHKITASLDSKHPKQPDYTKHFTNVVPEITAEPTFLTNPTRPYVDDPSVEFGDYTHDSFDHNVQRGPIRLFSEEWLQKQAPKHPNAPGLHHADMVEFYEGPASHLPSYERDSRYLGMIIKRPHIFTEEWLIQMAPRKPHNIPILYYDPTAIYNEGEYQPRPPYRLKSHESSGEESRFVPKFRTSRSGFGHEWYDIMAKNSQPNAILKHKDLCKPYIPPSVSKLEDSKNTKTSKVDTSVSDGHHESTKSHFFSSIKNSFAPKKDRKSDKKQLVDGKEPKSGTPEESHFGNASIDLNFVDSPDYDSKTEAKVGVNLVPKSSMKVQSSIFHENPVQASKNEPGLPDKTEIEKDGKSKIDWFDIHSDLPTKLNINSTEHKDDTRAYVTPVSASEESLFLKIGDKTSNLIDMAESKFTDEEKISKPVPPRFLSSGSSFDSDVYLINRQSSQLSPISPSTPAAVPITEKYETDSFERLSTEDKIEVMKLSYDGGAGDFEDLKFEYDDPKPIKTITIETKNPESSKPVSYDNQNQESMDWKDLTSKVLHDHPSKKQNEEHKHVSSNSEFKIQRNESPQSPNSNNSVKANPSKHPDLMKQNVKLHKSNDNFQEISISGSKILDFEPWEYKDQSGNIVRPTRDKEETDADAPIQMNFDKGTFQTFGADKNRNPLSTTTTTFQTISNVSDNKIPTNIEKIEEYVETSSDSLKGPSLASTPEVNYSYQRMLLKPVVDKSNWLNPYAADNDVDETASTSSRQIADEKSDNNDIIDLNKDPKIESFYSVDFISSSQPVHDTTYMERNDNLAYKNDEATFSLDNNISKEIHLKQKIPENSELKPDIFDKYGETRANNNHVEDGGYDKEDQFGSVSERVAQFEQKRKVSDSGPLVFKLPESETASLPKEQDAKLLYFRQQLSQQHDDLARLGIEVPFKATE